jgi:hypothetical protein
MALHQIQCTDGCDAQSTTASGQTEVGRAAAPETAGLRVRRPKAPKPTAIRLNAALKTPRYIGAGGDAKVSSLLIAFQPEFMKATMTHSRAHPGATREHTQEPPDSMKRSFAVAGWIDGDAAQMDRDVESRHHGDTRVCLVLQGGKAVAAAAGAGAGGLGMEALGGASATLTAAWREEDAMLGPQVCAAPTYLSQMRISTRKLCLENTAHATTLLHWRPDPQCLHPRVYQMSTWRLVRACDVLCAAGGAAGDVWRGLGALRAHRVARLHLLLIPR